MEPTTTLLLSLFVVALAFGAGSQFSRLCLLGGLRDGFGQRQYGRLSVYLVAVAVALLGAALAQSFAGIDLDNTKPPFRSPQFAWGRYIIGGFLFGVGMVLARGCPLRNMVRLGQGNLPSLPILVVVALTTYVMTRTSVYADWFLPWVGGLSIDLTRFGIAHQDLASLMGGGAGLALALALLIGLGLLLFAARHLRGVGGWLGAAIVGAMVAAAYDLTGGPLGKAALEAAELMDTPPEGLGTQSFSFAAPLGDVVHYLNLGGASVALTFGVVAVAGVLLGGLVSTLIRREFSFQGFANLRETSINLLGAILLGVGSVLAMGCTVGHGFSGIATLALGSFVAMAAIVAGTWSALKVEALLSRKPPASCG
ncbi:MAG: YeeE/YedE family protein [Pseudomonadota bacterium]